jgi:hypothetical protein
MASAVDPPFARSLAESARLKAAGSSGKALQKP